MASGGDWLLGTLEQVPLEFRRRKPDFRFPELCLQHPQPIYPLQPGESSEAAELESDQREGSWKRHRCAHAQALPAHSLPGTGSHRVH